mgnify:CR=1 FL=1
MKNTKNRPTVGAASRTAILRVPEEELRTRRMIDRLDLEVASGRAEYRYVGGVKPGQKPSLLTRLAAAFGLKIGGRT